MDETGDFIGCITTVDDEEGAKVKDYYETHYSLEHISEWKLKTIRI